MSRAQKILLVILDQWVEDQKKWVAKVGLFIRGREDL